MIRYPPIFSLSYTLEKVTKFIWKIAKKINVYVFSESMHYISLHMKEFMGWAKMCIYVFMYVKSDRKIKRKIIIGHGCVILLLVA